MRYVAGGRDTVIGFIQVAVLEQLPAAMQWYTVFADLTPYERDRVILDDVCAAAGVKPSQLMAEVVSCAMDHGRDVANLNAALLHPKVVAALGESAQRIDNPILGEINHKDRAMFLQSLGFAPVPRGATINVHASANAQAAAAAASEPSVPNFSDSMRGLNDLRRAPRALPAGGSTAPAPVPDFLTVDAELVSVPAPTNMGRPSDDSEE